ncbi:MAG: TolC family protein [Ignavibacteriales bacterium]|nr:TolC family protein [Ignavibacteriales bacterium]
MKFNIKKAIVLILIMPTIFFAQNVSLSEAINLALEKNEKVQQYKSKLSAKEFENKAAWGNFLPSINLQGSYNHLDDNLKIDLSPIRSAMIQLSASSQTELSNIYNILGGNTAFTDVQKYSVYNQSINILENAIPSFVETLKRQDYNSAAFVATQPLFLGGKLVAAKKYASAEEKASAYELQKIENEIITEVSKSYFQNLLLKEIVVTRKKVLSGMKQHQQNANKLFEQGLIANYHLLRAEVAVAEAERNLTNDQNNLELAVISFKSLVGLEDNEIINFTDSLKFNELAYTLNQYLTEAEINQPIIKMIEQKKISAEQNYNVARSEFLPQVAAFGKYELYPEYLSALEPRWAVGVQAKFNLFNGFKDYLKLQSASAIEEEVDHIQKGTVKNINLWINKSYRDVKNSADEFTKLISTLKLAEENYRQNSKRFNSGMGTSIEVIDARLTLEKIEIDRSIALFNYYSAIADLENASGKSIELLKIWNK